MSSSTAAQQLHGRPRQRAASARRAGSGTSTTTAPTTTSGRARRHPTWSGAAPRHRRPPRHRRRRPHVDRDSPSRSTSTTWRRSPTPVGPYFTGRVGAGWAAVRLDGRASFDPNQPCDQVVEYRWDVDRNGTTDFQGAGRSTTPTPTTATRRSGHQPVSIVRLTVCDTYGVLFRPRSRSRFASSPRPRPSARSSRRARTPGCAPRGQPQRRLQRRDPEGEPVTAIVLIGGVEVGRHRGADPRGQRPAGRTAPSSVNAALVPEGARRGRALRGQRRRASRRSSTPAATSLFDRTAPQVTIGAAAAGQRLLQPGGQVPATQYDATDNIDQNPARRPGVVANGCGRTLTVTATDDCGNVGRGRPAPTASPRRCRSTSTAPQEGQLVAAARLTWTVVGPGRLRQRHHRDALAQRRRRRGLRGQHAGQPARHLRPHAQHHQLPAGCRPSADPELRRQRAAGRRARHGRPPEQRSRPSPARRLPRRRGRRPRSSTASESRPPEAIDSIARLPVGLHQQRHLRRRRRRVLPTSPRRPTRPTTTASSRTRSRSSTDSIAPRHSSGFQVTVTDVNPTANPGGPYTVAQGVALLLDGSGTTAGHPVADPIATYSWNFGDGSPVETGPAATHAQRNHTYAENGVYNVTLTVDGRGQQGDGRRGRERPRRRPRHPGHRPAARPLRDRRDAVHARTPHGGRAERADHPRRVGLQRRRRARVRRSGRSSRRSTTSSETEGNYTVTVQRVRDKDSVAVRSHGRPGPRASR